MAPLPARTDECGTVILEYIVLLAAVALVCSIALVALGPLLVRLYLFQEAWLGLPVP